MVIYLYHTFICQYLCISIKSWPDPKVQHVQSKMGCKPSLNLSMVSHTQYTTAMLIWGPFSPLPFGWVCFQSYSCSLLPAHQYQVMNIKCTLTMYLSAKICSGVLVLRKTPESLHSGLTILCPLQPQKWGCRHCSPQPWHSAPPLENPFPQPLYILTQIQSSSAVLLALEGLLLYGRIWLPLTIVSCPLLNQQGLSSPSGP